MRFISLFSGIEGASVAFEPLGFKPVAFCDVDPFSCSLLKHHYPDVPNIGDITKVNWEDWKGKADLVIGGSPCQAFSEAGLKKGLEDPRGQLTLSYAQAIRELKPRWFIWENVAGVLKDKTNGYGHLLGYLTGNGEPLKPEGKNWERCGFIAGEGVNLSWRVLDSQHFGVPQRRERVFIIGHFGELPLSALAMFEPETSINLPEKAGSLSSSTTDQCEKRPSKANSREILEAEAVSLSLDARSNNFGIVSPTLTVRHDVMVYLKETGEVRLFSIRELERLQGFPDDYTLVPHGGSLAGRTARAKGIGNSFSVPVVRWLGERINKVDKVLNVG